MNTLFQSGFSNFLTPTNNNGHSSNISRFSPGEWVEIKDPQSTEIYYANPITGECAKNMPSNALLHSNDPNGEWWELYDEQNDLNYYYNTLTGQTEWLRPETGPIVPLSTIQSTAIGRRVSMVLANRGSLIFSPSGIKISGLEGDQSTGSRVTPLNVDTDQNELNIDGVAESATPEPSNLKRQDSRWSISTGLTETSDKNKKRSSEASSKILDVPQTPHESRKETSQDPPTSAYANSLSQSYPEREHLPASTPKDTYTPPTLPLQLLEEMSQFRIDGTTQKYFAVHKKGIFRRKVSMEKLLQWSKESLKQPLLILSKPVQKDALKCFKIIQKVMGDRSHTRGASHNKEIQWMLERAIDEGELRDEIYVQLCKQLTHNPNNQSNFNGWQLMCVLAVTFPPSRNFEKYMQNFVQAHFDNQQNQINVLSKHAYNKLLRISKTGPRGKVLTSEEIDQAKEAAFHPTVFGESLEYVMQMQAQSHPDLKIPRILLFLAESVLELDGQKSEGIFRLSGDPEAVTLLRLKIEKNQYNIQGITDPNVPSSLLKFWLRDLAEPLIPAEYYDMCIQNAENPEKSVEIIEKLPGINRVVVHFMLYFLQLFTTMDATKHTKMTVANLAMVFAPNFLRCPSENLNEIFEKTRHEQAFVKTLLAHMKPASPITLRSIF
ncbi:hypothetical protein K493DRAFT_336817 [Basidiobolus meristosporus CBS 931.73]|uniref:RhoGAP-domain-containing protein n=1 Tax=Basidiobolus meristosporus CBS 931.73 TaxID=1314790 RepID=A0A1Y1YF41_9FUNG|nr:hypothetical protein K493DRAFT_336817 [Basidiobolus meristosporus CBS 931.73]|eukprot:ORX96660.1 hypothetical protein K493DRAFT_336817 [Basidiobolus meristosporus CBS 931.73]